MSRYLILFLIPIIFLTACSEKKTNDPEKAYVYWAYGPPPKDVKPIRAQYWQSANWSKEYIIYIELAASVDWKKQYIKQNNMAPCNDAELPQEAPAWFKLNKRCKLWKHPGDDTSLYFEDADTGHFFIYEQQL